MRRMILLVVISAFVVAGVSGAAGSGGSGQARWVITDLGTLGGVSSEAVAVNERGTIVGQAWTQHYPHAFMWRGGKMSDLGTLPSVGGRGEFSISRAVAVNGRDQVVGYNQVDENKPGARGFLWIKGKTTFLSPGGASNTMPSAINGRGQVAGWKGDDLGFTVGQAALWQNGKEVDLGALPELPQSWAVAISERGQVVGTSFNTAKGGTDPKLFGIRSFVWQNGRRTGLGSLSGRSRTWAVAINGRGQIVGSSYAAYNRFNNPVGVRAFLWQDGHIRDLGTLGGKESSVIGGEWVITLGFSPFSPDAINESGQVVGWSTTASGAHHGFVWRNGKMADLGVLPGDVASEATAINDRGQVIGNSYAQRKEFGGYEGSRPFMWENGKRTALGTLGGTTSSPVALNNRNQIVGWATTKTGKKHAVLWTLRNG